MGKTGIHCPHCGTANPAGAAFCVHCGKSLGRPREAQRAPEENEGGDARRAGLLAAALLGGLALLVAAMLLISGGGGSSKVNRFPPLESKGVAQQSSLQARQRYMVADLQLGGAFDAKRTAENMHAANTGTGSIGSGAPHTMVVAASNPVYRYYQKDIQSTDISTAMQQFESGDLVINMYQFERVELPGDGWQVVCGGTQQIANADDFVMASDIGGLLYEEARVRYMLADMQLGSVADYYRQFVEQPAVAEAVRRWEAGVRLANAEQLERKIVGEHGWKVVYAGTDTPADGTRILLTTDALAAAPTEPPVIASCAGGEGRIAWILADIELGGVDGYYRGHLDDADVAEALRRWDAGVRLSSPASLERKDLPGMGWQIVYAGGEQRVNCSDIQLAAAPAQAPAESIGACGNPYWPVAEGAWWEFADETGDRYRWYMHDVQQTEIDVYFWVDIKNGSIQYSCAAGEITAISNSEGPAQPQLALPDANEIQAALSAGGSFTDALSGRGFKIGEGNFFMPNSSRVPVIFVYDMQGGSSTTYARDIGPVDLVWPGQGLRHTLVDYYIP